ncbi:hypothetical protein [Aeromicrobium stalagmiti]|uniref:hypothetical protein n=1 Tax=Aeromicrobium stalagmiti TaxID=2738988 RepID=UPI001568F0C6|nr:hypothetical protein [Aeromicrobium stalagmiti]NRQ49200.1 hypothetical protein [Aeromicrobium stalagmiti]
MKSLWLDELAEFESHWTVDACYGKQLTEAGWNAFKVVMPQALEAHDDEWLRSQMTDSSFWDPHLLRQGKLVEYNKPDAIQKLTLGEFNIAYIRGVATVLQSRGADMCMVYRADEAYVPRSECSAWEDQEIPVCDVLAGHRVRYHPPPGDRRAFSVPSGPNCHHSIRMI